MVFQRAVFQMRIGVESLHGRNLSRCQAGIALFALAEQRIGRKMTGARIGQESSRLILVACGQHSLADCRNLARRNVVLRHGQQFLSQQCAAADQVGPVVRRCTGQNPIVVRGKPLRFHQRFAATVAAAAEVRGLRWFCIEPLHNRLAEFGHHMHGAIPEVDDFLGMAERPIGIRCAARVSCVGAAAGKAAQHGDSQARIADVACESAIPLPHKLAVPTSKGKPNLDLDIGVAARLGNRLHTAKRGQLRENRIRLVLVLQIERPGFNHSCH